MARPISRSATRGEKAGESRDTSGWDSPEILRVSSVSQDLTLPSTDAHRLQSRLPVHLREVVPTTLPAGQINRVRHVAISPVAKVQADLGAHPAEVWARAGGVTGEESPTFMTAVATLLLMHAALVVVEPAASSCN